MSRIGIYAGTFDPVHAGHIAFSLQAILAAKLDHLYLLPERQPRSKQHVEHFGHRVAMLERALKPHATCDVMELVDVNFSVKRTLPFLQQQFPDSQLVFLFGSDVVRGLEEWPYAASLLKASELVVGLRSSDDRLLLHAIIESWKTQPRAVTMFPSYAPDVSSGKVREALRSRQTTKGLLKSVERYSDHNWLYISVG